MKKIRLIAVLMTVAAATSQAEIKTFANFERNGIPILIPEVQEYQVGKGAFRLPDTLTVSVPGEELIVEQLADELKRFGQTTVSGNNSVCRFGIAEAGVPEHNEWGDSL